MDLVLLFISLTIISIAPLIAWVIYTWTKEFFAKPSKGMAPPWGQLQVGEDFKEEPIIRDYDLKLLRILSKRSEMSIEEVAILLKETSYTVADRLKRLEERGFIARSPTGSIVITDTGCKYIEALRERLLYRRKESEILEEGLNK